MLDVVDMLVCSCYTGIVVFGVSESTRGRKSKVRGEACDGLQYVVM